MAHSSLPLVVFLIRDLSLAGEPQANPMNNHLMYLAIRNGKLIYDDSGNKAIFEKVMEDNEFAIYKKML